jgi:hypothetical protein
MPKTDDGFQGWRPWAHGDIWDQMTSPQRRSAFRWDLILGVGGAGLIYVLLSL